MKLLVTNILFASTIAGFSATALINNVVAGVGDTIYADSSGVPLSTGVVTLGYFSSGFDVEGSLGNFSSLLGAYTVIGSGNFGTESGDLGGTFAGFVQAGPFNFGTISVGNPLLTPPRAIYSFVGDGATLGDSGAFALLFIQNFADDVPVPQEYSSNPAGLVPLIGSVGVFVGDASGQGASSHPTIQLVPEPSTLLLSAFGALALLRRKR